MIYSFYYYLLQHTLLSAIVSTVYEFKCTTGKIVIKCVYEHLKQQEFFGNQMKTKLKHNNCNHCYYYCSCYCQSIFNKIHQQFRNDLTNHLTNSSMFMNKVLVVASLPIIVKSVTNTDAEV